MSEERFDRLENQLTQIIQGMAGMQQNITGMRQDITVMQQNITGMQQNITGMQQNITGMQQNITGMQQNIAVIQENMATKQDLALVQQTVSDIRTDISILGERIGSLELTTNIEVRESIRNQRFMINNTNYELANQERASARLQSRVERLEDLNRPNPDENLEDI
jgi:chromosome segregation ATPase